MYCILGVKCSENENKESTEYVKVEYRQWESRMASLKHNLSKFVTHMKTSQGIWWDRVGHLNSNVMLVTGCCTTKELKEGHRLPIVWSRKTFQMVLPCRNLGADLHGGSNDPAHFPAACAKRSFSVAWRSLSQCMHIPLIRNRPNRGRARHQSLTKYWSDPSSLRHWKKHILLFCIVCSPPLLKGGISWKNGFSLLVRYWKTKQQIINENKNVNRHHLHYCSKYFFMLLKVSC